MRQMDERSFWKPKINNSIERWTCHLKAKHIHSSGVFFAHCSIISSYIQKMSTRFFGFDLNFRPKNQNILHQNWANFGQKLWTFYRVWSLTESQLAYGGSTSMSFTSNPVLIMRKHMIIWSLGPRCIRSFLLCFVAFGTRPTNSHLPVKFLIHIFE